MTQAPVIRNRAEALFAEELRAAGKIYVYQPIPPIRLGALGSYRPDFYVPAEQRYYEVIGTRTAETLNRAKVAAARALLGDRLVVVDRRPRGVRPYTLVVRARKHSAVKSAAALEGVTMRVWIEEAIDRKLGEKPRREGKGR